MSVEGARLQIAELFTGVLDLAGTVIHDICMHLVWFTGCEQ